MPHDFFVQLLGVGAMISLILAYQQSRRSRLIACKLSADAFWVLHYLLLGGYGGMIPNLVGIFRELVFMRRDRSKWASTPLVPVVFILINWGIGITTFKTPINILPIAASTFVTISLWLRKPMLTKLISIPVSAAFLIYDLVIGSWIGAVNESFAIISIIVFFIKTAIKKTPSQTESADNEGDKKENEQ